MPLMDETRVKDIYVPAEGANPLPLFMTGIMAGFPSPADDYIEKLLDLNQLMIQHPAATFFVRVEGDSMETEIHSGDILVVDRAKEATSGKVIVAVVNGEFTVKRFVKKEETHYLVADNSKYPSIKITPELDFQVWGVVTFVIHRA